MGVTVMVGVTVGVMEMAGVLVGVMEMVGVTVGVAEGSGGGGGHGEPPVQPGSGKQVPEETSVISLFAMSNMRILSPVLFHIFTLLHMY